MNIIYAFTVIRLIKIMATTAAGVFECTINSIRLIFWIFIISNYIQFINIEFRINV